MKNWVTCLNIASEIGKKSARSISPFADTVIGIGNAAYFWHDDYDISYCYSFWSLVITVIVTRIQYISRGSSLPLLSHATCVRVTPTLCYNVPNSIVVYAVHAIANYGRGWWYDAVSLCYLTYFRTAWWRALLKPPAQLWKCFEILEAMSLADQCYLNKMACKQWLSPTSDIGLLKVDKRNSTIHSRNDTRNSDAIM